ncbi:hypothetical protein F6X40_34615 [Paraburkholderia sp. UCT31]|uniref:hypothetical protein n=1 Tax=Paraburkholderia sp. UCT31 TaxID=2615209 RepID=UPI001654E58B|nr:hypothetical protein [Paraburkholderia sp. UCT31]MBC8741697.1 hypothetical protein [Paraburkholderia sp. UCT31]
MHFDRRTLRRLIISALASTLTGAIACAAAPQPLPTPPAPALGNDGYVVVSNAAEELQPTFCPPGKVSRRSGLNPSAATCASAEDSIWSLLDSDVPAMPAQRIVDQRFGAGKAFVVGVSPFGTDQSVIYYKIAR